MGLINKILFPVDFSPAGAAAAPFIKRFAGVYSASLTLVHVLEPLDYSVFELYVRPLPDVEADHAAAAQKRLDAYLQSEFPAPEYARMLVSGDAAAMITEIAREQRFDLIALPTYSGGLFRRTLIGSTTAKVLNGADCPVLTPQHSEALAYRETEHREIACSVRLDHEGQRVLKYAAELSRSAGAALSIIHVIPGRDPQTPALFETAPSEDAGEIRDARRRIEELQRSAGTSAAVYVVAGAVKQAIIESTQRLRSDLLVIGRSPEAGALGRLRDLTYALVRDSLCPVLSV